MFSNGIFFVNSAVHFSDIRDGASNTMLLGETRYQQRPNGALALNNPGYVNDYPAWASALRAGTLSGHCCTSTTMVANAVDGINSLDFDGNKQFDPAPVTRALSSFHPGGCIVALADGSVHFLFEEMDINVYRDLAARADGGPVSGFDGW